MEVVEVCDGLAFLEVSCNVNSKKVLIWYANDIH